MNKNGFLDFGSVITALGMVIIIIIGVYTAEKINDDIGAKEQKDSAVYNITQKNRETLNTFGQQAVDTTSPSITDVIPTK